jgi:hypothetical protein
VIAKICVAIDVRIAGLQDGLGRYAAPCANHPARGSVDWYGTLRHMVAGTR